MLKNLVWLKNCEQWMVDQHCKGEQRKIIIYYEAHSSSIHVSFQFSHFLSSSSFLSISLSLNVSLLLVFPLPLLVTLSFLFLFSLLYTFLTFLYTLFSLTVSDLTPFPIQWCVWCLIHSGRLINVWGKDRVNERKAFSIWNSASLLWTTAKFHCWASSPGEWIFDSLSE